MIFLIFAGIQGEHTEKEWIILHYWIYNGSRDDSRMNEKQKLDTFGFTYQRGSVHLARTMMLAELTILLDYVRSEDSAKGQYVSSIVEDNCLAKRSVKSRQLTAHHLVSLYGLNPDQLIFRTLRFFWDRDEAGRPLLALLCAFTRDPMLQTSIPFVLGIQEGQVVGREDLEQYVDRKFPNRFSPAMLKSLAQNINSTWTQAGYVKGRNKKVRTNATATPGSTTMALLLGYLNGVRGEALFETVFTKMLDSDTGKMIDLVEESASRGWIVFKHIGRIIEVGFPRLINEDEMERINEQN